MTVGVFGAAVPATSQNASSVTAHVQAPQSDRASATAISPDRAPSPRIDFVELQKKGKGDAVKKIIAWLRKHAPAKFEELKKALKKSYSDFVKWYNGLKRPVRAIIGTLWSGTLWELFDWLIRYIF